LRDIAVLPENSGSRPWPLIGMLAIGLIAGAAIGGYAVSQRNEMKRLAKHAHRIGDDLAVMARNELKDPSSPSPNHRRKAISEV
jgi:hypothetical protein